MLRFRVRALPALYCDCQSAILLRGKRACVPEEDGHGIIQHNSHIYNAHSLHSSIACIVRAQGREQDGGGRKIHGDCRTWGRESVRV